MLDDPDTMLLVLATESRAARAAAVNKRKDVS
jgi:hypothetical protein